MKKLVILGAGAGGTMVATKMREKLDPKEWKITVIDRDWKDTFTVGLGAEYRIKPDLSARAGIGYMEAAIPEETFEPAIVDTDKYALSLGGGYRTEQLAVDIAYLAARGRERRVENSVGKEFGLDMDGDYSSLTQVISLNISWIF